MKLLQKVIQLLMNVFGFKKVDTANNDSTRENKPNSPTPEMPPNPKKPLLEMEEEELEATPALSITLNPGTVYITTTPGQTSFADLTIVVANNGGIVIELADVGILLPESLYAEGSLNSINPVADTVWAFAPTPTLGAFAAVPKSGATNPLAADALFNFTLKNISIAQQAIPAEASIEVKVKLPDGTIVSQQLTVAIQQAKASIDSFTSTPSNINPGETSTLSWGCTGMDYCILTPPVLNPPGKLVPPYVPVQVSPQLNTTYTLDAFAANLHLQQQVNVQVNRPQVASFSSVNGNYTTMNGFVSLEWTTNMEADPVAGNFVELSTFPQLPDIPNNLPLNTNGTPVLLGPITEAITITLTPGNNAGTGTESSPLIIDIISVSFYASPSPIQPGAANSTTLSWDVQAGVVSIDPIGKVDFKGSLVLDAPPDGTVYTLKAGTLQNPAIQTVPLAIANSQGPFTFSQFAMFNGSGEPGGEAAPVYGFIVDNPANIPRGGIYAAQITGLALQNGQPFPDTLALATQSPADFGAGKFYLINNTPVDIVDNIDGSVLGGGFGGFGGGGFDDDLAVIEAGIQWADTEQKGTIIITGNYF